jgi:TRAP-type C4-dicarboxylate transport system substrate-binding protein
MKSFAVATIVLFSHVASAQTIKLGTLAPAGSPWFRILQDMGEDWKRATGGRVSFRIYPGGVAGDEPDMVSKMRIGQLHAAALTSVGLSRIVPEIAALQLPLMYDSDEEFDYVRNRLAPLLEQKLADKGFIVLNWGDAGWVHLFSQKPVVHPKDLMGQKIFCWAGESTSFEIWKRAGFHPVEIAPTDIMTSLQTGLINAYSTTPLASLSFQWFALAKNMTDLPWAPLAGATIIDKRSWEQIPAELRPQLLAAARKSGDQLQREVRRLNQEAVSVMQKYGLAVHPVPPDARAEWQGMRKIAWEQFQKGQVSPELFHKIEQDVAEFRKSRGTK